MVVVVVAVVVVVVVVVGAGTAMASSCRAQFGRALTRRSGMLHLCDSTVAGPAVQRASKPIKRINKKHINISEDCPGIFPRCPGNVVYVFPPPPPPKKKGNT